MAEVTPTAQREDLARRHRQRLAAAPERTVRQRLRLRLLRLWGRRFRSVQASTPRSSPQRLLVIRPDHLGDLLFTTPALAHLRRQLPSAEISALVGPWGEAVLAGNPDVDRVLTCPFPGFTRQAKGDLLAPYRLLRVEAGRLRPMQFDLALILRFDHWWGAWLAAAAGIARRIGYDRPEVTPFLTEAVPYLAGRHEVAQNVTLVRKALAGADSDDVEAQSGQWKLRFAVTDEHDEAARSLLAGIDAGKRLVAVHPGSGAAVKRWRAEAWVALAQRLVQTGDVQLLFTGSEGERALIEPIVQGLAASGAGKPAPVSLAGKSDLGTLAAVYRRCRLVIGPDSGPLHLAVAVGTPTVHLFGPVDHRTFGPWGNARRHRVVTSDWGCVPCNRLDWPPADLPDHGCVRDVTVEQVWTHVMDLLPTD